MENHAQRDAELLDLRNDLIKMKAFSDLIIDEFRKNERWGPSEKIFGLYGKKEFDVQMARRAIIRFALRCPGEKARDFVTQLKKKNPQLLRDVEEILAFEEAQQVRQAKPR